MIGLALTMTLSMLVVTVGRSRGWPWWCTAMLAITVVPAAAMVALHIFSRAATQVMAGECGARR